MKLNDRDIEMLGKGVRTLNLRLFSMRLRWANFWFPIRYAVRHKMVKRVIRLYVGEWLKRLWLRVECRQG